LTDDSSFPDRLLEEQQLELIATGIVEEGYTIVEDFIPSCEVTQLKCRFEYIKHKGKLIKAGIGKHHHHQVEETIRGDYIKWINPQEATDEVEKLLKCIHEVRTYLNQTCFLGLKDIEAHFAMYPSGTFYRRHVDRFRHNPHRVISFVCYLNDDWQDRHGGNLCLYPSGNAPLTLYPVAGRAVFFLSEMEHEVMLSHRDRYSITGWMLDQLKELTFLP